MERRRDAGVVRLPQRNGALELHITGIVQGVGFRPRVYTLAMSLGLKGWVLNTTAGVTIHLEGDTEVIEIFCQKLRSSPPPLARIETFTEREASFENFSAFFIHESITVPNTEISIPPDVGTCGDCLGEFYDNADRRFGYDFTNCVNCGPRFSITRSAPYDRKNTSMDIFELCEKCKLEYTDPANRRFHAEPNACPVCGPQVSLTDKVGKQVDGNIRGLLKQGKILAIKGIGGYHLACDALNEAALNTLRERKRRQTKPFALMCRDLDTVRKYCELTSEQENILTSPARPIVLLQRANNLLSPEIAPGLDTLGIMLPYTTLHYGLFAEDLPLLVMTSANISGDPLILTEEEAYAHLGNLADNFVVHKREIINRSDDSVIMLFRGREYFIRRSRGYVPLGIKISLPANNIFAAGGDLKSSFAFGRGEKVTPSQYFADLDNLKNFEAYQQGVDFFRDFLRMTPEKAVADLHPDYFSTQYAESLGVPLLKVQHHKAHFASCMADNGLNEKVLGVVCDGTGFGEDGTIWGCEFFYGDYHDVKRVGSLEPYRQPRGDSIQKNPLHMATVMLYSLFKDEHKVLKILPESREIIPFAKAQLENTNLSILSTSSGRIFDVASALCGYTEKITYEGEAAMRMEVLAKNARNVEPYKFSIIQNEIYHISLDFFREMAKDKLNGAPQETLAARFHVTFAEAIIAVLKMLKQDYSATKVVFSGGTFQNQFLINYLDQKIPQNILTPYFHRQVPTNDGGLALGQIMLAIGGK